MTDLEYCIRYIDLPLTTKGMTVEDGTGFFNIYINQNLSVEQQQEAIAHELKHIGRGDFDIKKSLHEAETM
jgi:Zn-dependent peptidase ImmA (M78 family)